MSGNPKGTYKEIRLGAGLGDIEFGWSRRDLVSLLGPAGLTEKESFDDETIECFEYNSLCLSFEFSSDCEWLLQGIRAEREADVHFLGTVIGELTLATTRSLFAKSFSSYSLKEERDSDLGEVYLGCSDLALSVFFHDNDKLDAIAWGARLDEDDNYIFPGKGRV